jgi:hypothetical protein
MRRLESGPVERSSGLLQRPVELPLVVRIDHLASGGKRSLGRGQQPDGGRLRLLRARVVPPIGEQCEHGVANGGWRVLT